MRFPHRILLAALAACLLAAAAWAQVKQTGAAVDGKIRQAGFQYYYGMVFGDAGEYLKAARMPLTVVRDGMATPRDEKATRALLAKIAERMQAAKLSDEDRTKIAGNMLAFINEASLQFIGASTAALTFPLRAAQKPEEGDSLITLLLHRKDDRWQVIAEVTDSAPVPPDYLK